jgi:hypothetical protein
MADTVKSLTDALAPYVDNEAGSITFQHHRDLAVSAIGRVPYVAKSASYTLTDDDEFVDFDCTGAARTATLPAVATTRVGKRYTIRKTDATGNALIIDGNASETINGDTTQILFNQNASVTIVNTGAAWIVEASYGLVSGHVFLATAAVTLANDGAETPIIGTGIGTLTLPANVLRANKALLHDLLGFISCTGTPTLNIKLKLGSVVIAATGAVTLESGLSLAVLSLRAIMRCVTVGSPGTVIASGVVGIGTKLFNLYPTSGAAVNVDTAVSELIGITATWGAADPANTLTVPTVAIMRAN